MKLLLMLNSMISLSLILHYRRISELLWMRMLVLTMLNGMIVSVSHSRVVKVMNCRIDVPQLTRSFI